MLVGSGIDASRPNLDKEVTRNHVRVPPQQPQPQQQTKLVARKEHARCQNEAVEKGKSLKLSDLRIPGFCCHKSR